MMAAQFARACLAGYHVTVVIVFVTMREPYTKMEIVSQLLMDVISVPVKARQLNVQKRYAVSNKMKQTSQGNNAKKLKKLIYNYMYLKPINALNKQLVKIANTWSVGLQKLRI